MTKKELELEIENLKRKLAEKDEKIKNLTQSLNLETAHRISFRFNDERVSLIDIENNIIRFETHNQISIIPVASNCFNIKFNKNKGEIK